MPRRSRSGTAPVRSRSSDPVGQPDRAAGPGSALSVAVPACPRPLRVRSRSGPLWPCSRRSAPALVRELDRAGRGASKAGIPTFVGGQLVAGLADVLCLIERADIRALDIRVEHLF